MTLDLVNYEQAQMLKSAGFDAEVINYYDILGKNGKGYKQNWNIKPLRISRPSLALACDWLREKGLHVYVETKGPNNKPWRYVIEELTKNFGWLSPIDDGPFIDTHTVALSSGVTKALELLNEKKEEI